MKKPKHYYDDTYAQNFYMFIGMSRQQFVQSANKYLKVDLSEAFNDGSGGGCIEISDNKETDILIWTMKGRTVAEKASVIAHECLHAIGMMFEARGIAYSPDHDEPWAYMLAKLVEECYK
jgi:hypothetical protein